MLFGRRPAKGYNFTGGVRIALSRARTESALLKHEYVGTEHFLLALSHAPDQEVARIFDSLGVDLHSLRERVVAAVKPGKATRSASGDLPYTSRAKKVLELAMSETRLLSHDYVGTEHLLLGLLREEKGIAAEVLGEFEVTTDRARAIVTGEGPAPSAAPPRSSFRIQVDDTADVSIYEQIVIKVREGIATGELRPGDRLPTVRHLADELDIAPGTVARAYGELERLGVVVTEGARGTRVAPRERPALPKQERPDALVGLLRPVAVAAVHLGGTAKELRAALEEAMKDIFPERDAA